MHLDSQVKLWKPVSLKLAQRLPPHPRAELQDADSLPHSQGKYLSHVIKTKHSHFRYCSDGH